MPTFHNLMVIAASLLPVVIVLTYGAYEYVKLRKLRKSNQQKLADFNALIEKALQQEKAGK